MIRTKCLSVLACLVGLSGAALARADEPAGPADPWIAAALASPERIAPDREQDEVRRPSDFLAFSGVRPGMRIIDVFAAGGYYTELLARVVGVKGQVIAYNNPPYEKFAEKDIAVRYAGGRLSDVRQITKPIEALELPPESLDLAIFVMSYHDLYWRPDDGSWPPTDAAGLLGKLFAALKPGGAIVVQDHIANSGGDPIQVVGALHRIDPAVVRKDFISAGFRLTGQSDVLSHPEDDHSMLVFDPAIRGRTDQFLYRFEKPR
jgi:predicted methyltransferase